MELQEAIDYWTNSFIDDHQTDPAVMIDAESLPGWVIALRRPRDRGPYVEIWWEADFIHETQLHRNTALKVNDYLS